MMGKGDVFLENVLFNIDLAKWNNTSPSPRFP